MIDYLIGFVPWLVDRLASWFINWLIIPLVFSSLDGHLVGLLRLQ
jgi:hypothetical protein